MNIHYYAQSNVLSMEIEVLSMRLNHANEEEKSTLTAHINWEKDLPSTLDIYVAVARSDGC